MVDDVAAGLRARLEKVVVGNPRNETVTMGALVSLHQRDEVRDAVAALERATEIVYGDPMSVNPVDADPERGAFMAPVVLLATGDRPEPHEIEAFGPVTTLIPYAAQADLGPLAARGGAASSARSSPTIRASFARWWPGQRRITAVCSSSTATPPQNRRATGRRCRSWSTAAPDAPAAARSWAGCVPSSTSCSAPRWRAHRR